MPSRARPLVAIGPSPPSRSGRARGGTLGPHGEHARDTPRVHQIACRGASHEEDCLSHPGSHRLVVARWRDASGFGLEHCLVREGADGAVIESVLVGGEDDPRFALRYRITCDARWHVRHAEIAVAGDPRIVRLDRDAAGAWTDSGTPLPGFAEAIDIDISATPFTNTLPIRRLGLREGESADIIVVYIAVPELTITAAPQRYTCVRAGRRYRFESLDGDFVREIDVDDHGLVVSYPGLFERID